MNESFREHAVDEAEARPRARIVLAMRREMDRLGMRRMLESCQDLEILDDGDHLIRTAEMAAHFRARLVIVDLQLPGLTDLRQLGQFRNLSLHRRVVLVADRAERQTIQAAIAAGADGFLIKTALPEEIVRCVRSVLDGKTGLCRDAVDTLMTATPGERAGLGMTTRQLEILALLCRGLDNRAIAQQLGIKISTVKFHVRFILDKLQANNRTHAIVLATEHGLFPSLG